MVIIKYAYRDGGLMILGLQKGRSVEGPKENTILLFERLGATRVEEGLKYILISKTFIELHD